MNAGEQPADVRPAVAVAQHEARARAAHERLGLRRVEPPGEQLLRRLRALRLVRRPRSGADPGLPPRVGRHGDPGVDRREHAARLRPRVEVAQRGPLPGVSVNGWRPMWTASARLATRYAVPTTTSTSHRRRARARAAAAARRATRAAPARRAPTSGGVSPCSAWNGNVPNGWKYTSSAASGQARSATAPKSGAGRRYANAAGTASGTSPASSTHHDQRGRSLTSAASAHAGVVARRAARSTRAAPRSRRAAARARATAAPTVAPPPQHQHELRGREHERERRALPRLQPGAEQPARRPPRATEPRRRS